MYNIVVDYNTGVCGLVLGGINFCSHDYCVKIQHGYHDIVYIL